MLDLQENSGVDLWAYLKYKIDVVHTCGHPAELSYGSRQAADDDKANQEGQACARCQSAALVATMKKDNEAADQLTDPDIDVQGLGTVCLNITHKCGHPGHLLFGSYEAAAENKKRFQEYDCAACFEKARWKPPVVGH